LVAFHLPASTHVDSIRLLRLPERKEVPCDVRLLDGGMRQLIWVHTGGKREYLLEPGPPPATTSRWQTQWGREALEVLCEGKLVTRYVFSGAAKPYLYPIYAQTGVAMTRAFPMERREGESTDHPHQRSFWFTHGDVNGVDFWTEGVGKGRIVHREFSDVAGGRVGIFITTRNEWRSPQGQLICTDTREVCVYDIDDLRVIDLTITIRAGEQPLRFGDTKEGTFGIRIPSSMELRRGKGTILTAEGKRDKEAWGTRATWCLYSGEVAGETYSIAVLDHPNNPHHPTYWHVRDYGLFAANPFGWRDFQNNPNVDGSLTVPAGGQVTFRYRTLWTKGTIPAERLNALYRAFAPPPQIQVLPLTRR
ncbi:MAG: PmoA family protein, partial [bacterium]|nr:PmoA family protein [bacterium]